MTVGKSLASLIFNPDKRDLNSIISMDRPATVILIESARLLLGVDGFLKQPRFLLLLFSMSCLFGFSGLNSPQGAALGLAPPAQFYFTFQGRRRLFMEITGVNHSSFFAKFIGLIQMSTFAELGVYLWLSNVISYGYSCH